MVAVAVLWVTVGLGMLRTGLRLGDERTISYLGTVPSTAQLFGIGLVAAAVLLSGFAWAVSRRLRRATGFLALFLAGMACQAVVALVPLEGPGAAKPVHVAAGLALGLSLPLFIWRFAAAQPPGPWRRLAYRLTWLEVAGCVTGVALSRAGRGTLAEAVPAVLFHLWVILVTLVWPGWRPDPAPAPLSTAAGG